jgi:MinD-like ATPase involved in chromosome partitioning or flagellar assembly
MANPRHAQKQKLLRQLRTLDVDHVVLDLSAGSAFNVLDFFLEARHPILVVVPEPTSIENAYHFLKSAFFRSMSGAAKQSPVKAAITRVLEAKSRQRIRSPRELIDAVSQLDPSAGEALRQRSKEFRPLLVVNQSRTVQHRKLGAEIRDACAGYLGTDIEYLGTLERDESVRVAVGQRRPVLDLFPSCAFSMDLEALAVRLLSRTDGALGGALSPPGEDLLELDDGSDSPAASALTLRVPESELAPVDLGQPGASLRGRREQLHLDLSEIYRRTRIRHLEHIEGERFDRLPPEVYVRGYVVQYARALGIREAEALASSFVERYRQARAGL